MSNCEQEGTYRGEILDMYFKDAKDTKAVAMHLIFKILDVYNHETAKWEDMSSNEDTVASDIWIIKRDGSPNEAACASLKSIGWDGSFEISSHDLRRAQFEVTEQEYKGRITYAAKWIKPFSQEPFESSYQLDPKRLGQLAIEHGAKLRAIMGVGAKGVERAPFEFPDPAPTPPPKIKKESGPPPVGEVKKNSSKRVVGDERTQTEAWTSFEKMFSDEDKRNAEWTACVTAEIKRAGVQNDSGLSPESWGKVCEEAIPF
jgi:hypothetical protein